MIAGRGYYVGGNITPMNTPTAIQRAAARLRHQSDHLRQTHTQADIVHALSHWAHAAKSPDSSLKRAAALAGPFPYAHVAPTLDALLASLHSTALRALIDSEGVQDALGAPVIAHIIAGNTPLLAWTSLLRALLMRSASLVKLPTGSAGDWAKLFQRSLAEVAPDLAAAITLAHWPGGAKPLDRALCQSADLVMAYGSDSTIAALRALTPPATPFVAYGHALSIGLITGGYPYRRNVYPPGLDNVIADDMARAVLRFSGTGCLSVKAIYVCGTLEDARRFAHDLAEGMHTFNTQCPLPPPSPAAALLLQEARALAQMQPGADFYAPAAAPGGVLLWPHRPLHIQSGDGIVTVQCWPPRTQWASLWPADLPPGLLQGCALIGVETTALRARLVALGISRIAVPAFLQCPPLSWRQNNQDVLRSLLPRP